MPEAKRPELEDEPPVEPEFEELPKSPSKARNWWPVLIACAGIGAIYLIFSPVDEVRKITEVMLPGWENLLDCSYTASLDGTKELNLFDNRRAVLYDKSKKENGKYLTVDGNWMFDETTKLYTVKLNGEAITYSIVEPEQTGICMLIKGDLGAADLRGSWFASTNNNPDAYEDRERDTPGL